MKREAQVRTLLNQLAADLDRVLSLLQHKLLWMAFIENHAVNFQTPINDGDFRPPRLIMMIRTTSAALRTDRPHFENEMRRSYLNDLYLVASRYAILLTNLLAGKSELRPEFSEERRDAALEGLFRFLTKEDKKFLHFFRRVRNSIVHYEGRHNRANRLDYTFLGTHFKTEERDLGESILFGMRHLLGFHYQLGRIFDTDTVMAHRRLRSELDR